MCPKACATVRCVGQALAVTGASLRARDFGKRGRVATSTRARRRAGELAPTSVLLGLSLKQANVSPSAMPVVGRVQGAHARKDWRGR